jgi:hypothetical protein
MFGVEIIKYGRNDPCYCDSGKKYKKCCLSKDESLNKKHSIPPHVLEALLNPPPMPEPHLYLVPSNVWNGYRWRAIWNTLHYRPLSETFHEFLVDVLLFTFGKEWHEEQLTMDDGKKHIIMKWKFSFAEWTRNSWESSTVEVVDGFERRGATPTGEVKAFLQLAYDLYCLQVVSKLPHLMVKRLRNYREFQGVRYEIAVAAMIARAGFDIEFFDKKFKAETQCEFIAVHKETGIKIGVEAKSRRRIGILNEEGTYVEPPELRGDVWRLFEKARKQKPQNLPFIIFIDLNIPPALELPEQETPLLKDLYKMIFKDYGQASDENPDPFNMIMITNYAYYYAGNETKSPNGECYMALSQYPETKMDQHEILLQIFESVRRYSYIPEKV